MPISDFYLAVRYFEIQKINPEYEKNLETQKTLLIWTIFVWWLAFITKEMLEFYNNSSAFNHNDPFASFKPRHYYELISENDTKTAHCEETNHEIYEVMSSMQDRMKSPKIPGQSFSHRVSVRAPVQDTKYSKDRPRNWVTRSLSEVIVSKTNVFSDVVTNSLLKKKNYIYRFIEVQYLVITYLCSESVLCPPLSHLVPPPIPNDFAAQSQPSLQHISS